MSIDNDVPRGGAGPSQINCDDGIDWLAGACVIFAYADPALSRKVDGAIREPPLATARWRRRREWRRFAFAGTEPIHRPSAKFEK